MQFPSLRRLPGVSRVFMSAQYRPSLDRSVPQIGAPVLWGPALETAGGDVKIAIIDTGVDQTHRFFAPAGYTMPPGFPKGQRAFTTAEGDRRARIPTATESPAPWRLRSTATDMEPM